MRLTMLSDYALRLLIMAASSGGQLITIAQAASLHRVSKSHLMKVANTLTKAGYLQAVRGRNGGLMLARQPADIRIGDVFLATEPDFQLVECFGPENQCILTERCRLPRMLDAGMSSFIDTMNQFTLADALPKMHFADTA